MGTGNRRAMMENHIPRGTGHVSRLFTRSKMLKSICWYSYSALATQDQSHGWGNQSYNSNAEICVQSLCNDGQLNKAMEALEKLSSPPSDNTYHCLLRACLKNSALYVAKQVWKHIGQHRSHLTGFLGDYLVVTLAKCGAVEEARELSSTLSCRSVYSWSAMISACVDSEKGLYALEMFDCMQKEGIPPNNYTYVSLFKACSSIPDLELGKKMHIDACKKGFTFDLLVNNTLISMYAKCREYADAEAIFISGAQQDIVSWNAMFSAYVEESQLDSAFRLYWQMLYEDVCPDKWTFAIMLHACTIGIEQKEACLSKKQYLKAMYQEIGEALHADAYREECLSDILIGNTLIDFYGKCGNIMGAENMFVSQSRRDVVSWNVMLSAYIEGGVPQKALQLYTWMQGEGYSPDLLTLVLALQACGVLVDKDSVIILQGLSLKEVCLEIGRALHAEACRNGFSSDALVENALLTMYGKCGSVVDMEDLFSILSQNDIVSWNSLLSAYVNHGLDEKVLLLYKYLQKQDLTMDDVTLVCILQACGEAGSLELCKQLHFQVVCAGLDQNLSMAATLIHSYGSCASVTDAMIILDGLKDPDIVVWNTCIASYVGGHNFISSLQLFEEARLVGIKPVAVSFTLVLSACCHSGVLVESLAYFSSMIKDYGTTPNIKHYGIIIDLLGRAGDLSKVESLLRNMPPHADLTIWLSLLGACRRHGNLKLAVQAFRNAVQLQPKHPTAYVLMSNIYNDAGLQKVAADVERSRLEQDSRIDFCTSWIEESEDLDLYRISNTQEELFHVQC